MLWKNFACGATESLLPPNPCAIMIAGAGTFAGRYKLVSIEIPLAVVIDLGATDSASAGTVTIKEANEIEITAKERVKRWFNLTLGTGQMYP